MSLFIFIGIAATLGLFTHFATKRVFDWLTGGNLRRSCSTEREAAMNRRIGWGYGYGAGWVDGTNGWPASNVPPPDGRSRLHSADPNPFPRLSLFRIRAFWGSHE